MQQQSMSAYEFREAITSILACDPRTQEQRLVDYTNREMPFGLALKGQQGYSFIVHTDSPTCPHDPPCQWQHVAIQVGCKVVLIHQNELFMLTALDLKRRIVVALTGAAKEINVHFDEGPLMQPLITEYLVHPADVEEFLIFVRTYAGPGYHKVTLLLDELGHPLVGGLGHFTLRVLGATEEFEYVFAQRGMGEIVAKAPLREQAVRRGR